MRVRFSPGGGSRVRAASQLGTQPPDEALIERVEQMQRAAGQPALFSVRQEQAAFDEMLAQRGYRVKDPVIIYAIDPAALAAQAPPITVFETWPPLAIQEDIWRTGGIGADRLAVMAGVTGAKISLLGRIQDQPAGTAFVATHKDIAMLHALEVLPAHRRRGLARIMMQSAASWALRQVAAHFALLVTRANVPANGLYTSLGFQPVGDYHYRLRDD